jgi:hypothetical protein
MRGQKSLPSLMIGKHCQSTHLLPSLLQMKNLFLLVAALGLATSANAQFSVSSGAGDTIPAAGATGGPGGWDPANVDHDLISALAPGFASVMVPNAVTCIDSVVLDGLTHTWVGDTMGILRDPNGVGYVIWIRPDIEVGQACCGSAGDLLPGGTFTFVEPGTSANGELPFAGDMAPGVWDQSLSSNAPLNPVTWPSPDEMIMNVPLSGITGPSGVWTISIYDFAGGDVGSFTGFTLNGNGCSGPGTGTPFCDPATNNSSGSPAVLSGSLGTGIGSDLHLDIVSGAPGQLCYMLVGNEATVGITVPGAQGPFCLVGTSTAAFYRYNVSGTNMNSIGGFDALGNWVNVSGTSTTGFGFDVPSTIPAAAPITIVAGDTWHFQGWYRDTGAGVGFSNFTNGLSVTF